MIFAFKSARSRSSAFPIGRHTATPLQSPNGNVTTSTQTRSALDSSKLIWGVVLFAYASLFLLALRYERLQAPVLDPLFLLFTGASLLFVFAPATGPRGQRVVLLPVVGLASVLLLPPVSATLPLLLASGIYAATRESVAARRGIVAQGLWLALAAVIGSKTHQLLTLHGPHSFLTVAGLTTSVYGTIYLAGRRIDMHTYRLQSRAAQSRARHGWRMETMSLFAGAPVAVLMALVYPEFGVPGVALAGCLLALLILIAHFGFEVAMLREQVQAMEKLSAVTLSQTNPQRVIERFLQLSSVLIAADRSSLWLVDDSHTRLERVSDHMPPGTVSKIKREKTPNAALPVVRFGEGLVGRVAERQAALILRDVAQDPRASISEGLEGAGITSLLLPLIVGGEVVAVAQFERETPGAYSTRDLNRVSSLASQTAATLANVRMHQDVYNQSITDELTGLFNRRHMQQVIQDEHRRSQRYHHNLSIVTLDVDSFKSYNDTYGHPQGDVLLKMLADLLRENVRNVDIVGRMGGEEFLILMPETTKAEAWRIAERLRQAVGGTIFPGYVGQPESTVIKTISLGLAAYPDDSEDPQMLLLRADQALYRAKHGGRNQIVVVGDPAIW